MSIAAESPWWIRIKPSNNQHAIRWFLFHHAGGSALSYAPWIKHAPEPVEIYCLDLPGRGNHASTAFATDWQPLINALTQSIRPLLNHTFVFLGHSLGAGIAFELCQSLNAFNLPTPLHLYLSGRIAPTHRKKNNALDLSSTALIDYIRGLQGTNDAVLKNQSLMRLFLPRLRADLTLNNNYIPTLNRALNTPITVFAGTEDGGNKEDYQAWQQQTNAPFQLKYFPGNHFFINDHFQTIIHQVNEACSLVTPTQDT